MAYYGPADQQFRVNGARSGGQYILSSAPLDDGGYIILWASGSGTYSVQAQRYDSAGAPVGAEFQVASAGTATSAAVSALDGGGFVIAWQTSDTGADGSGSAIKAQVYDSSGQASGSAFLVNNEHSGNQGGVTITTLADGSFVASWTTSQPASGGTLEEVKARLFDSTGAALGGEFLVNSTTTGAQAASALAATAGGGFVAVWQSGTASDVHAQLFDSSGAKVGSEFVANTTTSGSQMSPSVAVLADGRLAIVWRDVAAGGFPATVKGQLFDSSGVKIGGEFLVTDVGGNPQTDSPQVRALPDGGFVTTWSHSGGTDVSTAVWGRIYDSAGVAGTSFLLNSASNLFESSSRTLVTAAGDIVTAWSSTADFNNSDVNARTVEVNRAPVIFTDGGGATAAFTVAEGQQVVTQVLAADRVGPAPVSYAITGGADSSLFAIDSTGHLTFLTAPDSAAPADADLDNVYEVVVTASDGELTDSQALSVTVAASGRGLLIASAAQVSVRENGLVATRVSATDAAATFAITGGADAAGFVIDSATGILSFVAAPNFEAPADSGANNVYDVEVTASAAGQTAVQALSVTVGNSNEGAEFSTPAAFSTPENGTAVATLAAVDAEGDPLTYSIVGGADSSKFGINSATGALTLYSPANYEAPTDSGANNVYDVIVRVTDGDIVTLRTFAVSIANVNEGVMISSNGGGAAASFSMAENQSVATTVTSRDNPTGTNVTYSLVPGSDSSKFTIDSQTGVLSFVNAPNFEVKADQNADNVYQVTVQASDGTVTDTQALSITITNVNEPFSITSSGALSQAEGSLPNFLISTDEQDAGTLTFTIVGGADAARFKATSSFGSNGGLSFLSTPNYEAPTDADGNNSYEVTVQASDGTHSATKTFLVSVTNVQENVYITSNNGYSSAFITRPENQLSVITMAAVDPDNGAVSFSISGGADAAKFAINAATGELSFLASPDYEVPADSGFDRVYNVTVSASDGASTATQALSISISNVVEPFAITSHGGGDTGTVSVNEGIAGFTVATNEAANLSFSLSGADAARFTVAAGSGGSRTINFVGTTNYEAPTDANGDNVYDIVVTVSGGGHTDAQTLSVVVGNVNEAPAITSNGGGASAAVSIAENGTAVASVTAADPENGSLTYSISGGADSSKFTIGASTGVLAFVAAPDFEAPADAGSNGVYDVTVMVSDGTWVDTQAIAVTVTNVEEGGPVITSNGGGATASVSVAENGSAVTTVTANATPPIAGPISFAIAGGADASKFAIDAATGALTFVAAPNFEVRSDVGANGVYDVIVRATDGVNSDTQAIAVTVTNVNEAPVITSGGGGDTATVSVLENVTTAATITSTDPENTARSYSIIGGADSAKFTINSVTGALSFVSAPNFEAPTDSGANGVYDVVVRASDGVFSDTQTIAITILNANEAPVIGSNGAGASASLSVAENSSLVTTVAAGDPENDSITYSISGGSDASKFTINASTGVLSFVSAPNFEVKSDVGANGIYDVIVRASDGVIADTQAIAVTVTNVNEAPVITSNGGGATASINLNENGSAVTLVTSTDPENNARTYSIVGGADAAKFTISSNGILDLLAAADYENPTDAGLNNVYDVVIQASDGSLTDTQAIAVSIVNLNEAPVITSNGGGTSAGVTLAENATSVTTVVAPDPEGVAVTYSISGGLDSAKFTINSATGALSFVAAPNFESPADSNGDNVYWVVVKAADFFFNDMQSIAVTVVNANEAPIIASNGGGASASLQVDENSLSVTTVQGSDPDGGAPSYSIAGGDDAALFSIDSATGALAFLSGPDFEAPADADLDNVYEVTVSAGDGGLFDLQDLFVTVSDLLEGEGMDLPAFERLQHVGPVVSEYTV